MLSNNHKLQIAFRKLLNELWYLNWSFFFLFNFTLYHLPQCQRIRKILWTTYRNTDTIGQLNAKAPPKTTQDKTWILKHRIMSTYIPWNNFPLDKTSRHNRELNPKPLDQKTTMLRIFSSVSWWNNQLSLSWILLSWFLLYNVSLRCRLSAASSGVVPPAAGWTVTAFVYLTAGVTTHIFIVFAFLIVLPSTVFYPFSILILLNIMFLHRWENFS